MLGSDQFLIGLVTWGNAYLQGSVDIEDSEAFTLSNIFSKYHEVIFWNVNDNGEKVVIANSVKAWLKTLKLSGCLALRVRIYSSDKGVQWEYETAGLVGGGVTKFIEAVYLKNAEAWISKEVYKHVEELNLSNWHVYFRGLTIKKVEVVAPSCEVERATQGLQNALCSINSFAKKQDLEFWSKKFDNSLNILSNPTESHEREAYNDGVLPLNLLGKEAASLLCAMQEAWVFGCMGSWNDLGLKEVEEYKKVSSSLYNAINNGILAIASNSISCDLSSKISPKKKGNDTLIMVSIVTAFILGFIRVYLPRIHDFFSSLFGK